MKKTVLALAAALAFSIFGNAQTEQNQSAQPEIKAADLHQKFHDAQQEMLKQLRALDLNDSDLKPLLDSTFLDLNMNGLGGDDHLALPPADNLGFSEMMARIEQQLQQIDGIDTNELWQLMQRFYQTVPEISGGQPVEPNEQPADKTSKKRKRYSL